MFAIDICNKVSQNQQNLIVYALQGSLVSNAVQ